MLVRKLMKVLSNLMGNGSKIKYTEVAIQRDNNNMNIKEYVDGVVESGSNENGNYIKYADGTMICYKSVTASVNFSANWGGLYEGKITLGSWAQVFLTSPNVQVSNGGASGALIECYDPVPTPTSAGGLYLVRPTAYTTNVVINVLAIGKWK